MRSRAIALVSLFGAAATAACGARTFVRLDESGSGSGESGGEATQGESSFATTISTSGDGDGDGDASATATSTSTTGPGTVSDEAEVDVESGPKLDVADCGLSCCEVGPNDDPCRTCVKENCCMELQGCADDEACACMLECIGGGGSPPQCAQSCNYSPMDPTFGQLVQCAGQVCGMFC